MAFFCIHVPLLVWSSAGRAETLLIALTMALLVMVLEGSAWRGLDNLFIPIGGFFLLQTFLTLDAQALLTRLLVTVGLVAGVLASRRSTTMLDDSLLAGAFLCYVTWALAGWRWVAPPAIAFVGFSLNSPDVTDSGRRFHTIAAMLAVWAAAIAWLGLAKTYGRPDFIYPFTLVFAAHIAIFVLSRTAHRHAARPIGSLARQAILQSWVMLFVPFVGFMGVTTRNIQLAASAGLWIAAAVAVFVSTEPGIRDTPQSVARWVRQAASAGLGSALGWLAMVTLDRLT